METDFQSLDWTPYTIYIRSMFEKIHNSPARSWTTIAVSATSLLAIYYTWQRSKVPKSIENHVVAAAVADPENPLLIDHVKFQSYTTKHATYPSIRKFYRSHVHAEKLQVIADLPLLVFIHGIGGSLVQFAPLLSSLSNIAPCFGIELPGHGCSRFEPTDYKAYTFEAFTSLWTAAIDGACQDYGHSNVIIVAHSLGCSIAATLAATDNLSANVIAIVAICPQGSGPTPSQAAKYRRLLGLPDAVMDVMRWFDRRGGENSTSVNRFVGEGAGPDLRRLQLKLNRQFQTPAWKRTVTGILPTYDADGRLCGGLPGRESWQEVNVPILLIAGESDTVTKASEVGQIVSFLQQKHYTSSESRRPSITLPLAGAEDPLDVVNNTGSDSVVPMNGPASRADDRLHGTAPNTKEVSSHHSAVIKTAILPAPAAHALMYDHATYRTVAGLIEDFLARHVSSQLNFGWQLQTLTTSGKWDVKNLEKWKKVVPISAEIDGGLFRALKTLREQDEVHTPSVFVDNWRDKIFAVVDISHDSPMYDTATLDKGGIQYHKFPTVSKIPPTVVETRDFIALIDRLHADESRSDRAIGVHCHYGYNRTGFFIVCYLMERRGYRIQDAIEEFAKAKPPGIRHDHFIDTLFMRYCVGLKKAPSFKIG